MRWIYKLLSSNWCILYLSWIWTRLHVFFKVFDHKCRNTNSWTGFYRTVSFVEHLLLAASEWNIQFHSFEGSHSSQESLQKRKSETSMSLSLSLELLFYVTWAFLFLLSPSQNLSISLFLRNVLIQFSLVILEVLPSELGLTVYNFCFLFFFWFCDVFT